MSSTETAANSSESTQVNPPLGAPVSRRKLKTEGRKKRTLKLKSDKEFAKAFFADKSKRAADRKTAFRKKKNRKK